MYAVKKGELTVAIVDDPIFVRKLPNGDYGLCGEPEATAVNVGGYFYHLDGREAVEGLDEDVRVDKIDGGFYLNTDAMQARADIEYIAMETGVDLDE